MRLLLVLVLVLTLLALLLIFPQLFVRTLALAGGGDAVASFTSIVNSEGGIVDRKDVPDGDWYLIERPFKTFRMGTGILAKGGETLGLTFYGHCNFQWSNNTTNKVHEGHFTFYSRPVVRDWRQVLCSALADFYRILMLAFQYAIAEDIFVLGYVRGEVSGCNEDHFISSATLASASVQTLHEIYGGQHGHLIVYRLNKKAGAQLGMVRRSIANPHSITGDWGAFERQYEGSPAKPLGVASGLHWDSAAFYQKAYRQFYAALQQENSRISGGGFAVAPGCYNTGNFGLCGSVLHLICTVVVWETAYHIDNEKVAASDCLPHYYRGRAQAISGMSVFLQPPAEQNVQVRF